MEVESTLVPLDKYQEIPELGIRLMVEKSREGEKTRIHWEKLSRVSVRHLTSKLKKE